MRRDRTSSGPLLPGEASTVLTVVSGLIGFGGVFNLILVAVVFVRALAGGSPPLHATNVTALGILSVVASAYLLTGIWLSQGRRRGGYLAIAALLLNILTVLGVAPLTFLDLILPVVALVGLVLAWPHLSDDGRVIDERNRIVPRA